MVREFGVDPYTLLCLDGSPTRTYLEHRELCSVLCGGRDGGRVWGRMDTYSNMYDSLSYAPETGAALLIGCTPVQNKKVF